ncbi:MAG: type II toxin-antitoxin system VapC family toxin [Candidatus Bathyarchaeia archaeon]
MTKILIASDLLLAIIKKEDRLKPVAERILEKIDSGELKGVYASTAVLQEIIFWFYNRQLHSELAKAVNVLSHLHNVEWIPITPEVCLTASLLINEYNTSPFDAYHVATAIPRDKTILSTEHIYDKIKGITRVEPAEFSKNL